MSVNVSVQPTPNPNAMKFNLDKPLGLSGSKSIGSREGAEGLPWAQALMDIEGVASLFALGSFVTVMKAPGADWASLTGPITEALQGSL